MQEPEPGWSSRAGYNTEEDGVPAREGRVSSTGSSSQQEPAALSLDHRHIHTTTLTESFWGPLVRSKRGRKLASSLNPSLPQTQGESLTQPPKRCGLSTACTAQFQVPLLPSAHTGLQPLHSFNCSQMGLGHFQTAFLGLPNHKHTATQPHIHPDPCVGYYVVDSPITKDQKNLNSIGCAENTSHPICEPFN